MEQLVKRVITIRKDSPLACISILFEEGDAEKGAQFEIEISGNQKIGSAKAYFQDGTTMRCE